MRSIRATGGIVILLLAITAIGVALAPLGTPAPNDDSGEFRAYIEPRLAALVDSAVTVDGMVNEKSRNILALRSESNRIDTLVTEIDAWLAEHEAPAWAEPVLRDYRDGTARVTAAIAAANDAIRSFDFSKMASMIPIFDQGTALLQRALDTLRDSAVDPSVVH